MSKVMQFLKLDLLSIKPYLGSNWNIIVFLALMVLLTLFMRNPFFAMVFVPLLAVYYAGYPFALGESVNMDGLYATLGIERRDVVRGRYLFAFFIQLAVILCAALFAPIVAALYGYGNSVIGVLSSSVLLLIGFWWLQVLQLPLYFKFGYNKARLLVFIVIVALLLASMLAFMAFANIADAIQVGLPINQETGSLLALLANIPITALLTVASYRISLQIYKARDF